MLPRLQEVVLRTVQRYGPDIRAADIQEAVSKLTNKPISFGGIFTTVDRLGAKGYLRHRKGEQDNARGGRAPKLFTITGEGIAALNEATRISYAIHQADGDAPLNGSTSKIGSIGR